MRRRVFLSLLGLAPADAQQVIGEPASLSFACPVCKVKSAAPGLPLPVGNADGSFSGGVITGSSIIICSNPTCGTLFNVHAAAA